MTKRITVCGSVAPDHEDVECRLSPGHNPHYHASLVQRKDERGGPDFRIMWWMGGVSFVSEPIDLDAPGEIVVYTPA